ncbi:MAG: hypothetical protein DRN29_04725 [Thermoplasmata archaeon]|nr:MAG: hypothetical protein DRN29_04725 [Thermoplasmata archaeon]
MIDLKLKLTSENWYQGHLIDLRKEQGKIKIVIAMGTKGLNMKRADLWLGILLHEIGHAIYYLSHKDWEYLVFKSMFGKFTAEETIEHEIQAWKFSLSVLNTLRNWALATVALTAYYLYYSHHPLKWSQIQELMEAIEKFPYLSFSNSLLFLKAMP